MAIYKKPFRANPPAPAQPAAPRTAADKTRTFDARPKPSDNTRRDERGRPSLHIDRKVEDPLDAIDDKPEDEA